MAGRNDRIMENEGVTTGYYLILADTGGGGVSGGKCRGVVVGGKIMWVDAGRCGFLWVTATRMMTGLGLARGVYSCFCPLTR